MVVGLCALLLVATVAPVGAAFTSPVVIRWAPVGRIPELGDIAAAGDYVGVTWTEDAQGDPGLLPKVFAAVSATKGSSWLGAWSVEADEARQPSVAICGYHMFVAYAVDLRSALYPSWWAIILYHRDLQTSIASTMQISGGNKRAQHPDVACGGDRVWVAWDDKLGTKRHAYVTHSKLGSPGTLSFATAIDLGRTQPTGNILNGPSVAAVKGRGYVAWAAPRNGGGSRLRFKRYLVGDGPGYAVTPVPTTTLASSASVYVVQPEMEAQGDRVVIAYPRASGDSAVRVSGNRGVSFASAKVLADPAGFYGYPASVAVRGSRIAVIMSVWGEGPAGNARFVSGNGGASFSATTLHNDKGGRVVSILKVAGAPKLVEAWDGFWYNVRKLRFHRET